MIPAPCGYVRAGSVEHAVRLLEEQSGAKLLAGGHSLIPLMKLRLAQPGCLVDLGKLEALSYVREDSGQIAIGALTRHAELTSNAVIRRHAPLLADAAALVGDPQVRRWGTVGGSLCHADPAADLGAVALALDALLVVRGPRGERTISIDDWFRGFWSTALGDNEMLVEIRVRPIQTTVGWNFQKFTRRAIDWATVGVAVVSGEGRQRVAMMNMGDRPLRARAVEEQLESGAPASEAANLAARDTNPPSDVLGSAGYRRSLAPVLTKRALCKAAELANARG